MKNKIAIIGTVGLPAKYGGFETLSNHLVSNLSNKFDFTVYCSKKKYTPEERVAAYKGAKLKYINLEANGVQSIIYDSISILKSLKNHDVLLILGIAGAWLIPFIKWFTNKKIIISIDSIEWKRKKWSLLVKLYLWWAEKIAVKYSHFDISDNESIQEYMAIRYKTLSKVIEYGADHITKVMPTDKDFKKYTFLNEDYAVKVCRIEPENNIEIVLEAFASNQNLKLVLVGNWSNNEYGKRLKIKFNSYKNIFLFDPIYNQREINLIRSNATIYVHGHSAGGTNLSLVEAMFLGLPVMAFNVSYNETTTENKALYFSDAASLANLILKTNASKLAEVSQNMKTIANRRYTWEIVAQKYNQLFDEALALQTKASIYNKINTLDQKYLDENQLSHLKHTNLFYEKR